MDGKWIDRYFRSLSRRVAHDGSPKQLIYPRSEIKEPSIDLQSSLKMFFQEVAFVADDWTDVHRKYGDRRSFSTFLWMLENTGLDKYKLTVDNDIHISLQPNGWSSLEASLDDVLFANEYYRGSLSLAQLLRRIYSESSDDFSREQAKLLESFLDHLIKIQQEQQFAAYSFSQHLEQLRKSDAVGFSSNAVDDDDKDRYACPLIISQHPMDFYVWRQKHIFNSLCTMSCESARLLKKLNDSYFTSPSSIKECNKILDIIVVFVSKFKKSQELLDLYLIDGCHQFSLDLMQLVMDNKEVLNDFGELIKNLQEQGVERKSVAETLLGCFVDVVNMNYNRAERGNPSRNTRFSLQRAFSEAAKEALEMINEAVEKLNSVRGSDLTSGGSPLGSIILWRIIYESSLINLRLDLICKKHSEIVKLGVKLPGTSINDQLDQIRLSINQLLTVGESVLVEFIAMHKTVAEVSFVLGDAFTTGGALSSDARHLGISSKHVDQSLKEFDHDDFPWDKHVVHDYFKIDVDDPKTHKWMEANPRYLEYIGSGLHS